MMTTMMMRYKIGSGYMMMIIDDVDAFHDDGDDDDGSGLGGCDYDDDDADDVDDDDELGW